ncbi:MAG: sensor histidine kinase [Salinibacter sp.]
MSFVPKLVSYVSRLALKIGGTVGLAAGLGTLLTPEAGPGAAALVGLGVAGIGYAASHLWLHRRLRHLQSILRQIRNHEFEDLSPPSGPQGDELSTLLWEVYRTGQSLENEIQELKERESYRREFIGNVSHELKTPIFSVQGFAETLLDGALDDDTVNRTFLEKILHHADRLDNLARDLSTITKIETDELDMSSEALEVGELFDATLESVEVKAEEKGITPQQEVPPNLPDVYGDFDHLRRVLVNLVDNAIKYNEEGGTVRLKAEPRADEVEIQVVDDGIGIPSEDLSRLTERFYRVDKSRSRNQGGTGLGLAIVKHILGAHDRTLHVESTPDEGSTFSFTLPTSPYSRPEPA